MPGRILVVDDDRQSRRIFESHLTPLGFEVVLANNGEEAIDILRDDPYFDLIITDVMMPYMTGFDFTRELKENPRTKDIPVIGTSAFTEWSKARDERELIVDGFIPKPIEKDILLREIKRVLSGLL